MTTNYHWRPVTPPTGGSFGSGMRDALAKRFVDDVSPCPGADYLDDFELGLCEVEWLRGLRDALVVAPASALLAELCGDAEMLIDAIAAHGTIRIEVEP